VTSPVTPAGLAARAREDVKIDSIAYRIGMRIQNEPRTMAWLVSFFGSSQEDRVKEAVWRLIDAKKAIITDDRRIAACGSASNE
jgi:hypothetical protein